MMRIVLDTNLLARAAMPGTGLARELPVRCTADPRVLILSDFIISELSRVLRYPRMLKAHGLNDDHIEEYLAHLRSGSVIVVLPEQTTPGVATDPDDDRVVATAIAGQAAVLSLAGPPPA